MNTAPSGLTGAFALPRDSNGALECGGVCLLVLALSEPWGSQINPQKQPESRSKKIKKIYFLSKSELGVLSGKGKLEARAVETLLEGSEDRFGWALEVGTAKG